MRPGPVTSTGPGKRAVAAAVAALVLAAVPGDDLRAQRIDDAATEAGTSPRDILQRLGTAAERLQRAATRASEREEQIAALKGETGNLGRAARKAVGQWPATQQADPGWEWVRVLVFLVQTALVAQGYDPGKPDGLMGPKTMLALIAWSAVSGPPMNGNDEMSYIWGIDGNVAHLLHGTLEAIGLSPGPKDRFLGPDSVTALDRWDGTFRFAAMMMPTSERVGRDIVMNELGAAGPSDTGKAESRSTVQGSTDRSRASGQSNPDCVKFSWHEKSPLCDKYVAGEGHCRWILQAHNMCGYEVWVHFLGNIGGDVRSTKWWQEEHMDIGRNWAVPGGRDTGSEGVWDIPEGVKLDLSYCVNRYDAHFGARATRLWEWYRNAQGVGAVNTTCLNDE